MRFLVGNPSSQLFSFICDFCVILVSFGGFALVFIFFVGRKFFLMLDLLLVVTAGAYGCGMQEEVYKWEYFSLNLILVSVLSIIVANHMGLF